MNNSDTLFRAYAICYLVAFIYGSVSGMISVPGCAFILCIYFISFVLILEGFKQ
jgi:hypothetical protein